jgi:RimJ/RimL family protein N-acetyltransferase
MLIRPATEADVPACDEIYRAAKEFMHSNGNPDQWSMAYPSGEDVRAGISDGTSFVCEDCGEIVATFFYRVGADPTYQVIYDGRWLTDGEYAVIHRIAVKYNGRGIIGYIFKEMFDLHPNLRIDTHENNIPMKKALSKAGFKYCGVIHLPDGAPRIAFQKI